MFWDTLKNGLQRVRNTLEHALKGIGIPKKVLKGLGTARNPLNRP